MGNNKNPNQKQPGEKPPGKFHYNPGNMSGKTAGVIKKNDIIAREVEANPNSDKAKKRIDKTPRQA